MPAKNMVLVGTSDRYMKKVLKRKESNHSQENILRLFERTDQMNPKADYWGLRRKAMKNSKPEKVPDHLLYEFTLDTQNQDSNLRIVHNISDKNLDAIKEIWTLGSDQGKVSPLEPVVKKTKDDNVTVTYQVDRIKPVYTMLFLIFLMRSSAGA